MDENNLIFEIVDENNVNHKAQGLFSLVIENDKYFVYLIDINGKNEVIVSKIINFNNKNKLVDIINNEERQNVFKIINTLLTMSDNKELSKYLIRNKAYLGK